MAAHRPPDEGGRARRTRSWSPSSTTPRRAPRRWGSPRPTWSSRSWSRAGSPGSRRSTTPRSRAWSAPSARCAPATSASSHRSPAWSPAAARRMTSAGSTTPASGSSTRAPRLLPRQHPVRAVQPLRRPRTVAGDQDQGSDAGRLPPWGAEGDPPAGKPAKTLSAAFGGHTTTGSSRTAATSTPTVRRRGRRVPGRQRARRCGCRSATPATATPPATPCPETKFEGGGNALLFHAGKVVAAPGPRTGSAGAHQARRPRAAS